jgi:hypothetical protein
MESEVKRMREESMTSPKREGTGPARREWDDRVPDGIAQGPDDIQDKIGPKEPTDLDVFSRTYLVGFDRIYWLHGIS